jgi:HlyD family secretion protein
MRIPERQKNSTKYLKRLTPIVIGTALMAMGWLKINAMSSETVVSQDDLIIAVAEKGQLIREIRAPGTLVPVQLNYLAASFKGRVKEILLEASDPVCVGTIIMTLDNPELRQAVDAAQYEVEVLQAAYNALTFRWHQELLKQRIIVADFKARLEMAKLRKQANQRLLNTNAVSDLDYNESVLLNEQLKYQHQLEIERLNSLPQLQKAELAAAQAKSNKALRQLSLQQKLADGLKVRATTKGVLQEIPIEVGEQVAQGTILARIAGQDNLKAQLRVQESQVKQVEKGQSVVISAGGKQANGLVRRIDPAVQQGTVLVDVYFSDEKLVGARPDLRIDGVIRLEHLRDVLKIKRPVFAEEYSSRSLFVLNENQTLARRKQVEFGRGSVDVIEILSMLNEGDKVVISDTKRYSEINEITLR